MKKAVFIFFIILLSGCASTVKIEIDGNSSVGDNWVSFIMPEGIVQEVSNKYRISMPLPGAPGKFIFKFRAIGEGEAGVVLMHYFRGGFRHAVIYDAVVDKNKKLTMTIRMRETEEEIYFVQKQKLASYDIVMYNKIIAECTESIEYNIDDEYLYIERGYYHALSGDAEQARKDFETALLLVPDNTNALKYLKLLSK